MRGALVMTMVMISPSQREVSPAEQLCQTSRLVPPRFRLMAAESRPESLLMIFFLDERLHIAKDGHRRAARGPTRQGARSGGRAHLPPSWMVGGPPLVLISPNIFYIFWKWLPWSFRTFGAVQNRSLIFAPFPAQNPSCRHSLSLCKPCKIRENRHKYYDILCNNNHNAINIDIKAWCIMDISHLLSYPPVAKGSYWKLRDIKASF